MSFPARTYHGSLLPGLTVCSECAWNKHKQCKQGSCRCNHQGGIVDQATTKKKIVRKKRKR